MSYIAAQRVAIGLIWGGECGESVPLATQGHWSGMASHLVTARYMLYSTPLGNGAPDVYPQRTKGQCGSPHHPTGMHLAQL